MQRIIILALYLAFGMCGGAFAQSTESPPLKQNENSAALEKLKTFKPSHIQTVEELFLTLKSRELYEEAMQAGLRIQVKSNPQLAQIQDVFETFFREYCSWDVVKPEIALSYLENFSEDEIRQLIAFYNTEIGRKTLTVLPKVFNQCLEIGKNIVLRNKVHLETKILQRIEELNKQRKPPDSKSTPSL